MADNAYGFLEVKGLVTAVVAADAMVKSAYVRLQAQIQTDPGLITLVVAGDIGACSAAVEAGRTAALGVGEVLSDRVMGRPDPGIDLFF
ncbi:MAG: hypothetical protein A3F78_08870 [Burkholderiales bacterium RIFCSPLOWO2_12_FULL_61_40]|nr:MAG: hypothetical protein A3F78_08870 [Burkholderiales bacterium RIFCSPLOWO2_12_FULL_61_40]